MLSPALNPLTDRFVNAPAGYDTLFYGFHHRKKIAAGVQNGEVPFFDGQGGTTLLETNLTRGTISKQNAFLLQWLNCAVTVDAEVRLTTDANLVQVIQDVHGIMHKSIITMSLGPTEYFTLPTWRVPAGGGLAGFGSGAAAGTDFGAMTNGMPSIHNAFPMRIPLESQDDIKFFLKWPVAFTTLLDAAVTQVMTGILLRPHR